MRQIQASNIVIYKFIRSLFSRVGMEAHDHQNMQFF